LSNKLLLKALHKSGSVILIKGIGPEPCDAGIVTTACREHCYALSCSCCYCEMRAFVFTLASLDLRSGQGEVFPGAMRVLDVAAQHVEFPEYGISGVKDKSRATIKENIATFLSVLCSLGTP